MALDDFKTDNNTSDKDNSTDSNKDKKKKQKQVSEQVKREPDLVIEDAADPAYEVEGIEKVPGVKVKFDTNNKPSGQGQNHYGNFEGEKDENSIEVQSGDTMTSGSNTVLIQKDEFEQVLDETGLDFNEVDYSWASECIYEAESEHGTFSVRVYSTIEQATEESRGTGNDSVKTQIVHNESGRPVFSTTRTYRVPTWSKNLKKKINELLNRRNELTTCSKCGSIMVIRENSSSGNKFFGCTSYPECRNTKDADL